jgi:hypothetical protein
MTDKDFVADAERAHIDIDPIGGKAMEELIARIYATPKSVVERVKGIYAAAGQKK